jgi:hypothetical protein
LAAGRHSDCLHHPQHQEWRYSSPSSNCLSCSYNRNRFSLTATPELWERTQVPATFTQAMPEIEGPRCRLTSTFQWQLCQLREPWQWWQWRRGGEGCNFQRRN